MVLFKSFDKMTAADYQELGLKAGLEIHQQLLTDKKLFCRCPAGHYSDAYDAEILRHMRPTLSELGEYDGTALMEFKTRKEIIYRVNQQTVCTYEMDDTPPFEINQHALDIAFKIAMLMNYKLVNEIHIARKQYLDGSIPTGFQRTTIVGVDGWIPYKDRKIGLIQLGLEEDACREVSDIGHQRVYLTDRLGMPLIEPVTEPVLHTPQEVADVANIIRWLVRSTGKVRTGIGSARQDVNVSIRGGTRVEIKGVPRIPLIPTLIYNEAMRQHALLEIRAELARRGITEQTFQASSQDVTGMVTKTSWAPLQWAIAHQEHVHCVNLKGFSGILSHPTQTGKVFSKEISDRVRVIACLTRLPNILTSESTEETISSFIWGKIRKAVQASSRDALILVWGSVNDIETAVNEIIIRAREAAIGVPSETRQALADGTNGFERILPGPERMYPDTDLPPLEITSERLHQIRQKLPPPTWEREKKYRDMGVPKHLITPIAVSRLSNLFEELLESEQVPISWYWRFLFEKRRAWRHQELPTEKIRPDDWRTFFRLASAQPSLLEDGETILCHYMQDDLSIEKICSTYTTPSNPQKLIREKIRLLADCTEVIDNGKKRRFWMGKLMQEYRGKISAALMQREIDKYFGEGKTHE